MNIPAKLRAPLSDADHVLGPADAPVVLVEYGDYACPFCAAAHDLVAQLLNEMQRSLRYAFRNFPLWRIHPDSVDAARAAEAAALQQRYWQMHDTLFENQHRLDRPHLINYAAALGLNLKRFPADFSRPAVGQRIESDLYGGVRSGVNGTPTFFINGWRFDGNLSYQGLRETFERTQSMAPLAAR